MAESRRYGPTASLDIEQILLEAQSRWLRPVEICEILRNYHKFRIAPEPPNRPPNGSLFLFDRKQLRYFRKDGHNWRKKKDGKTVKEAHERLKAGSIDVLHCYYAHGEENENFQRRSYWMLEEELMHIVLVHYREVKGNRTSSGRGRESEENLNSPSVGSSPVISNFLASSDQSHSPTTDTSSLTSTLMSEYDDPESADNHQASSRYHSYTELQQYGDRPMTSQIDVGLLNPYLREPSSGEYQGEQSNVLGVNYISVPQRNVSKEISDVGFGLTFSQPRKQIDVTSPWEDVLEQYSLGSQHAHYTSTQAISTSATLKPEAMMLGQLYADELGVKKQNREDLQNHPKWQVDIQDSSILPMWSIDQKMQSDSACREHAKFEEQQVSNTSFPSSAETFSIMSNHQNWSPLPNEFQTAVSNSEVGSLLKTDNEENNNRFMEVKRPLLEDEGLKKFDSFSRWMSKELGEVDEVHVQSASADIWTTVESGDALEVSTLSSQDHLDEYLLSPSVSQDQLFSIHDFSPNWAYTDVETKVLIMGTFLKSKNETENYKWSCMFGELEVPAEVVADGVLRCHAPVHKAGRVPFYVACSNRLACSEVREFEYRVYQARPMDTLDVSPDEFSLRLRLGKFLSLGSIGSTKTVSGCFGKYQEKNRISSLLEENADEWVHMMKLMSDGDFTLDEVKEQFLQNFFKERLYTWLLQKMSEDGKGPNILDKEGQSVLHLVAALGYDWAIEPIIAAGVNVNFRDVHGWTALHWAASFGRERTVVTLVSLDGAPGALTDPTPQFPSGRTPADLASSNGHKGISGYLAESALTTHLSSLTLKEGLKDGNQLESCGANAVQTVAERSASAYGVGDVPERLSLKDSLDAVCNATQAAARIHEVFRVQSFQRKQIVEYGDGKFDNSNEQALSMIAVKSNRPGQNDLPPHSAAIRIQNKFRGWKGRKDFLIIRRRIVKIQALVRGHQVRKKYKNIIWSVGIVEKVILRWRRKGSGLRGFRSEALNEGPSMDTESSNEDEYDFLREGRKQTEARLDKALARVKSMVQYPEARDQYRRLLTVVSEIQERKVLSNESSEATMNDDMFDLEALLEDDTFMPTAT